MRATMTGFEISLHHTPVPSWRAIALRGLAVSHHSVMLLLGVIGIIAGALTLLASRAITPSVLLRLIAVWAIITSGTIEIVEGFRLRKVFTNGQFWLLMGILSKVVGGFALFAPGVGTLVVVPWIGAYALGFGMFMLIWALQCAEEL